MLHVWLRAQHSSLAIWDAQSNQWQIADGWQQLQETYSNSYKTSNNKALCLYFPTSYMLQVDTQLNTAQLKQLGNTGKQYLFEETSLTSIDQLAIRQINQANITHLYALAQSDIEAWQQSAALAGLTISALLPDFLLLPTPEEGAGQQIVLYQDPYTTLIKQADYQGLAVSYLPLIFERLPHLSEVCSVPAIETADSKINDNSTVSHLTISNLSADTATLISDQQLLLTPLTITARPIEQPERQALNFFIKTSDSKLSPYLRVALMVALSALTLQIATDAVQWYRYDAATTSVQQAVATQYQSWFINERLNLRTSLATQMQNKLRSDTQASSPMAALARISPLIKQSSLKAQALSIQPTALSFTLIAPDRNSLDQFANTLNEQGLSASLERVSGNEQGQFSGQITVNTSDNAADEPVNNNTEAIKPANS